MNKINIICVDDQREVLNTLSKELQVFEKYLTIEDCESAVEALELIEEIDNGGNYVAVIISDHIMPEMSGVEFLAEINNDDRFSLTKKLLLTGQATHQDTIEAINIANIDKYIEKPWTPERLIEDVKILLTRFIVDSGIEYNKYMPVLHQVTLFNELKNKV